MTRIIGSLNHTSDPCAVLFCLLAVAKVGDRRTVRALCDRTKGETNHSHSLPNFKRLEVREHLSELVGRIFFYPEKVNTNPWRARYLGSTPQAGFDVTLLRVIARYPKLPGIWRATRLAEETSFFETTRRCSEALLFNSSLREQNQLFLAIILGKLE